MSQSCIPLGESYDIPSSPVNAMKVEEVHKEVTKAAARARAGKGPTLLEFRTYRYKGHSMSDPAKYRTKEELAEYKNQDPIEQVKATIKSKKFATEKQIEAIGEKIKQQVAEAVEFAEQSPFPDPSEAFKDVYVQTDYPFIKE